MERLGRILLVGVVAGLALSVTGTATRLAVKPLTFDVESFFKEENFEIILLGFFFDLAVGFFYVLAFAIFRGACPESYWKKFVLFWLLLLLIGVVPRAADVYRYFKFPDVLVLAWLVAWAAEALVVTALVVLLFPKSKAAAQGGNSR
jgi:quinol-cytochrome oxidoreductase complex cytochrome b subunit